ncbi:hypothetical protein FHT87_001041 [Rhizobium sp. BK316]|nr:hypothetical protein [Rhizobium sp. BK316]
MDMLRRSGNPNSKTAVRQILRLFRNETDAKAGRDKRHQREGVVSVMFRNALVEAEQMGARIVHIQNPACAASGEVSPAERALPARDLE